MSIPTTEHAEEKLDEFIANFAPIMQKRIRGCRAEMSRRYPDAVQLVWDNYNFLVIGFGASRSPSAAPYSLAAQAKGVSLCFLQRGTDLPDPTGLLRGSGKVVRNVQLADASALVRADVVALMEASDALNGEPRSVDDPGLLVIQSLSAKQRPRR